MKKILGLLLAVSFAVSSAFAGPVSYYGKLQAKNSKLYAANTQAPVQLKGMSMFWDTWDVGYNFYRADVVDSLVSKWKIEIIRVAHGTASNRNANWENLDKAVIEAAIKNDIYVIIDFHSHNAHNEVDEAKDFFKKMASAYGSYPNVIFEIYNEPMSSTGGNWNNVKNYADVIMPHIRQNGGTDNLIVVGNDGWSSRPDNVSGINDKNYAATFHFYAVSHSLNDYKGFIESANNNGVTVFVTEWGTTKASGAEAFGSEQSDEWLSYLDSKGISWCNWSVSNKSWNDEANAPEYSAAFMGQENYDNPSNWQYSGYSESGKYVYDKLNASYTNAPWKNGTPAPSSSASVDPTSSAAVVAESEIIDNFNDNTTGIEKLGPEAYWYLYSYGTASYSNKEKSAVNGDGETYKYWDMISGTTSNYYAAMKTINVSSGSGVGMEAQLPLGSLAKCSAISYKYKGAAHKFRASMDGITADKGYEHTSAAEFTKTTSWTPVTITASSLKQASHTPATDTKTFDWAKVFKISFIIESATSNGELDIDDVACVGELSGVVEVEDDPSSSASMPSSSAGTSSPSSANSSASENPSSSASTPVVSEANIDDFEDGDNVAKTGEEDYWYAFTDVDDGGKSTISNENKGTAAKPDYSVVIAEAAAEGSEYGAGLTGITLNKGTNKNDPYVAVAVNIAGGLAGCKTVTYKYKGAAHNFKVVMSGDEKGGLTGYNRHFSAVTGSTSWTEASIDVADLMQDKGWGETVALNMAKAGALHWEVKGTASPNYLYIDDVSCEGATSGSGTGTGTGTGTATDLGITEDGTNVTGGYWYAYLDDSGAATSISNEKEQWGAGKDDWKYVILDSDDDGNFVHMDGIKVTADKAAAIGTELNKSVTCSAYSYEYMGAAHTFKTELMTVKDYDHYSYVVADPATAWTKVEVTTSQLKQEGWGKSVPFSSTSINKFTWAVKGANVTPDYLKIRKFQCVGKVNATAPSATGGSTTGGTTTGGNTTGGNTTGGNTTGGNNNGLNGGYNNGLNGGYGYDAISVSMAQSGLKVGLRGNTLNITVAKAGLVKVQVFDMMGHVVESRVDNMAAGTYAHEFGAMAKGSYVVRVQQGSYSKSVRLQVR